MGYGDNIMATGMAAGANARGKRIAFGDEHEMVLKWDHFSEPIFRYNPNIAEPGTERRSDVEWIKYYRGHRLYNVHEKQRNRWRWRESWPGAKPGEIYLSDSEVEKAERHGEGFILIEPNVSHWKVGVENKQWPPYRFEMVASHLLRQGYDVVQPNYGGQHTLKGVRLIRTKDFREGLGLILRARYALLPEGGLHHAAAASIFSTGSQKLSGGIPATVFFGGFIPPRTTGYPGHHNLIGTANRFCGSLFRCEHCRSAMDSITVDDVLQSMSLHLPLR